MNRNRGLRRHPSYWAFAVHRASGLLLGIFLPIHLWVLSTIITGTVDSSGTLDWANNPWIKFGEGGMAMLLAAHLTGGLRLLAIEFLPWGDWQKTAIAVACGVSLMIALSYLLRAF